MYKIMLLHFLKLCLCYIWFFSGGHNLWYLIQNDDVTQLLFFPFTGSIFCRGSQAEPLIMVMQYVGV